MADASKQILIAPDKKNYSLSKIDSDIKEIYLYYDFDSSDKNETQGTYNFKFYFNKGFPGGNVTITNLNTNEVINLHGYSYESGKFKMPLNDIKITLEYQINNETKTISKIFYLDKSFNFIDEIYPSNYLLTRLKSTIFNGYLRLAYNKNIMDFDAHMIYSDDTSHSGNLACYKYKDFDMKAYKPKIKDFGVEKFKYNSPNLGVLIMSKCKIQKQETYNLNSKTLLYPTKDYYDLFFYFKEVCDDLKKKFNLNDNTIRIQYKNPYNDFNSLIVEFNY